MKKIKNVEIRSVFVLLCILFLTFLVVPIIILFIQSLVGNEALLSPIFKLFYSKNRSEPFSLIVSELHCLVPVLPLFLHL